MISLFPISPSRTTTTGRTCSATSMNTSSANSPSPRANAAASSTRPAASSNCLVEMLQPFKGRVYDPCCGSGGMFVQSERFVEAHNGQRNDVSIFGQE